MDARPGRTDTDGQTRTPQPADAARTAGPQLTGPRRRSTARISSPGSARPDRLPPDATPPGKKPDQARTASQPSATVDAGPHPDGRAEPGKPPAEVIHSPPHKLSTEKAEVIHMALEASKRPLLARPLF